jgi:hypothetical protein
MKLPAHLLCWGWDDGAIDSQQAAAGGGGDADCATTEWALLCWVDVWMTSSWCGQLTSCQPFGCAGGMLVCP